MKNLINLLKKFRDIFIFIFLQIIILGSFFNSKNYHRASFTNSSAAISGWVLQKKHNISKHFKLESEIDSLAKENAHLLSYQPYSYYKIQSNLFSINDTLYKQQYTYFPATVINSSVNKRNNFITLNKGKIAGVEINMGVISNNGIVGFVIDVSDHYSVVKTILSDKVNISAQIKEMPDIKGQIKWNGSDYKLCQFHGVTSDIKLKEGLTIITKGTKGIYPEGVEIGKITNNIINDGSLTLKVEVNLNTNFNQLYTVYLIKNNLKTELKTIESNYFHE